MFIKRLLTIIVAVPIIVWVILGTSVAIFQIISALFCVLAAWEWACLMGVKQNLNRAIYSILMLGGLSIAQFITPDYILWLALVWWLIAIIFLWRYVRQQAKSQRVFINGLIGFFCIVPAWVGINSLRMSADGEYYVLLFLALLWATDIGAYVIGMRFGKNKLAPTLSPGKTVEGAVGGFVFMIIILILGVTLFHVPEQKWVGLAIISVVMVFFSIVGDLFESMFKRIANVKDSSHIIPGHGGILDRLDSFLAAAPIFALGMIIFGIA
jgi:phosphatidate cytidylyltransferase